AQIDIYLRIACVAIGGPHSDIKHVIAVEVANGNSFGEEVGCGDRRRDRGLECTVPFAQHYVEIGTVINVDDIELAISVEVAGSDGYSRRSTGCAAGREGCGSGKGDGKSLGRRRSHRSSAHNHNRERG